MKRLLIAAAMLGACAASPPKPASAPVPAPSAIAALACDGHFIQGGFVVCKAAPGAQIFADGADMGRADANGEAVVGFDRDAPATTRIEVRKGARVLAGSDFAVAPQTYVVQRVDGLPQDTVTPTDPALLARIKREVALKNVGLSSRANASGFKEPWIWPVAGRMSGAWGNQRILNGTPVTPHMGFDIAAPTGTPIKAPASGVVTLAQSDMHYEGGLIFIDHGQGLISMYLHMSRVDVKVGDVVVQGQVIGAVGAKGRATGPHLCWRMKWRNRYLDPALVPATPLPSPVLPGVRG
jgi:murein DD-endopeptidase MepM/ murein hydrolase activator NlpD